MKKLSQLLESINEVDSLLELDFKDREAFKKYQAIHKMKPTTKVNIAGKDTTVGDEMGDDNEKPQAPKKTTGADIEKQASKSGKEKSDIEKDIMGDEPKSDEPVKLDDYGQEAIDSMDWNRYDDQGVTNVTKVINDLDDNVDEFNQQIYNVASELEGQIPDEDLDKLYSAEINVMDLDDEALSEVPREELEKKTKTLIDFHKKYSTIGKRTTAQEKDPNRKKVSGIKPGSSFGSNIGYRTGRNRGGGMYDNVNKSSTPLKELSKITTRYNK
jgi:hypothetical protein